MANRKYAHPLFHVRRTALVLGLVAVMLGSSGARTQAFSLGGFNFNSFFCSTFKWTCSSDVLQPASSGTAAKEVVHSAAAEIPGPVTAGPCKEYITSPGQFKMLGQDPVIQAGTMETDITLNGDCGATKVSVGGGRIVDLGTAASSVVANGYRIEQVIQDTNRVLKITPTQGGVTGGDVFLSVAGFGPMTITDDNTDVARFQAPATPASTQTVAVATTTVDVPKVSPPPMPGVITPTKDDLCHSPNPPEWIVCDVPTPTIVNPAKTGAPGLMVFDGKETWEDFMHQLMQTLPVSQPVAQEPPTTLLSNPVWQGGATTVTTVNVVSGNPSSSAAQFTNPTIVPSTNPFVNPATVPSTKPVIDPLVNPTVVPSTYIAPTITPSTNPFVNPTPLVSPTITPSTYVDPTTIVPTIDPTKYGTSGSAGSEGLVLHGASGTCNDGIDNDNNRMRDLNDVIDCTEGDPDSVLNGPCNDGLDNDGDRLIDVLDPDCTQKDEIAPAFHPSAGVSTSIQGGNGMVQPATFY